MVLKIDTVEGIGQRLQGVVPYGRFQLALPHCDAMPAHGGKLVLLFYVACAVALYLGSPELRVALWDHIVSAAFMPMPEATVDEDDSAVFAQHDVGTTGQTRVVQPIAEPSAEQEPPHQLLRFGVLPSYRCHTAMALLLGQFVHDVLLGLILLSYQFLSDN